jgi:hypothetical protein
MWTERQVESGAECSNSGLAQAPIEQGKVW